MSQRQRHLDASQGREVVYCHACHNEWYRDEQPSDTLDCPRCRSEITEIITPDNDPREFDDGPDIRRGPPDQGHYNDSDPEEEDIDQHVHHTGNGFFMHRTLRPGGPANHDDPQVDVLRRFTDMINDFHPPTPGPRPPGYEQQQQMPGGQNAAVDPRAGSPPVPGYTRTTFRASPFGTTTVTIHAIGGVPGGGRGGPIGFDTVFANLMNGPPGASDPNNPQARHGGQPPNPLDQMLQGLMAVFMGGPPGGVHGDAVYSQEALDRIITQLMEAQPHSSRAPPPASEEAIARLGKRNVQIEDLGSDGRAECTICIDELKVGDEVTVLPCKHWFHGECVTLWLKEHNTCPICRTPIEANNSGQQAQGQQGQQAGQQSGQSENPQQHLQPGSSAFPGSGSGSQANPWGNQPSQSQLQQGFGQDPSQSSTNLNPRPSRYDRLFRSQSSQEDRLNAIRNVAGANYRPPPSPSQQPQQSGVTNLRRNSHSPPPEQATRSPRVRSPESRSRDPYDEQYQQYQQQQQQQQFMSGYQDSSYRRRDRDSEIEGRGGNGSGSTGPLNWLRGQWNRHSGSGRGSGSGSGPGNDRSGSGSGDAGRW